MADPGKKRLRLTLHHQQCLAVTSPGFLERDMRFQQHTEAAGRWPPQDAGPTGEGLSVAAMMADLRFQPSSNSSSTLTPAASRSSQRKQELLEILDAAQRIQRLDAFTRAPDPLTRAATASLD